MLPVTPETTFPAAPGATVRSGLRSDLAYRHLKEELISGAYRAGQRLQLDVIARTIGASRQPVMDAVRRLETEGLLTVIPQVGTIVPTLAASDLADFFELHARNEAFFCELAAERRTDLEADRLLALAESHQRSQTTAQSSVSWVDSGRLYRRHNREFHTAIHAMARSPLLDRTAVAMWDRSDLYISTSEKSTQFAPRAMEAVGEHGSIARAIASRDTSKVRELVVRHITAFIED